jgi:hypothetical protein
MQCINVVTAAVSNMATAVYSLGTTGSNVNAVRAIEPISRVAVGLRGRVEASSSHSSGGTGRGRGQASGVAVSGGPIGNDQ